MKNRIAKRIVAIGMAATMVVGMNSISAGAVTETKSFTAQDVNTPGAPSSETRVGTVVMAPSDELYTCHVTSMSDITNRKLTVSCSTHTMTTGSIVFNNTGKRSWHIKGEIQKVTYTCTAYTSLKTALSVSGKIYR